MHEQSHKTYQSLVIRNMYVYQQNQIEHNWHSLALCTSGQWKGLGPISGTSVFVFGVFGDIFFVQKTWKAPCQMRKTQTLWRFKIFQDTLWQKKTNIAMENGKPSTISMAIFSSYR